MWTAVICMSIVKRKKKESFTLWYWVAALVWTDINYVLGNCVPAVRADGHHQRRDARLLPPRSMISLWITPAGVGAAYYLLPVAVKKTLFSHRLSLIGFWALAFFYPLNGVHHYIYSPIADWAQTIAIASSMMLILPVWAFSTNMYGTMRGQWWTWRARAATSSTSRCSAPSGT